MKIAQFDNIFIDDWFYYINVLPLTGFKILSYATYYKHPGMFSSRFFYIKFVDWVTEKLVCDELILLKTYKTKEEAIVTLKTVSALQIGASPEGKKDTLSRVMAFENEIKNSESKLVVMPEALFGGYPKGEFFGTYMGYRLPEGRRSFMKYHENAIDINGEEVKALSKLSERTKASLVVGVIERSDSVGTLYCSALFFDPSNGLINIHRKLMPTGTERLIWGMGDGSYMPVVDTEAGKVAASICWENHMPLYRTAMYNKGVQIWCAPTVAETDVWQSSMRHIAHEGRCFLISACQVQPTPKQLNISVPYWQDDRPLIRGGSVIINPLGDVIAGPVFNETTLLTADICLEDIVGARYDLDVIGHYARPDIFSLKYNKTRRVSVECVEDSEPRLPHEDDI